MFSLSKLIHFQFNELDTCNKDGLTIYMMAAMNHDCTLLKTALQSYFRSDSKPTGINFHGPQGKYVCLSHNVFVHMILYV